MHPELIQLGHLLRLIFVRKVWTFRGRAARKEFWVGAIAILLLLFLLALLRSNVTMGMVKMPVPALILVLNLIYFVASVYLLVATFALTCRRYHDVNLSGWWPIITTPVLPIGWMSFFLVIDPLNVKAATGLNHLTLTYFALLGGIPNVIICLWPSDPAINKYDDALPENGEPSLSALERIRLRGFGNRKLFTSLLANH